MCNPALQMTGRVIGAGLADLIFPYRGKIAALSDLTDRSLSILLKTGRCLEYLNFITVSVRQKIRAYQHGSRKIPPPPLASSSTFSAIATAVSAVRSYTLGPETVPLHSRPSSVLTLPQNSVCVLARVFSSRPSSRNLPACEIIHFCRPGRDNSPRTGICRA